MPDNNIVNIAEETTEEIAEATSRVLKLRTPVEFEGAEHAEIDLSGLDKLTGKDIRELDRLFKMKGGRLGGNVKEFDSLYLQLVAARATSLPLEFFDKISIKDATRLEVEIRNFLIL